MADEGGVAVSGHQRSGRTGVKASAAMRVTVGSFSISKRNADRIDRVKRWEERSETTSLELTGRS